MRARLKLILSAAEAPFKILYWVAAETGMRPGELADLRVADLDLEARVVQVY